MTDAVIRFDEEIAAGILNQQREVQRVQTDFMDGLAKRVIHSGGYCDDLIFATAFFGGIDPDMNWGNRTTNEELAAATTAEEFKDKFKTARKVADLLRFSVFEPFVETPADRFWGDEESMGIVLPGSDKFNRQTVGYRIQNNGTNFMGAMVFSGLSRARGKLRHDQHPIFRIERAQGSTTLTRAWAGDTAAFGVAAARRHMLGERAMVSLKGESNDDAVNEVNVYLDKLRADAREFHDALKVAAEA